MTERTTTSTYTRTSTCTNSNTHTTPGMRSGAELGGVCAFVWQLNASILDLLSYRGDGRSACRGNSGLRSGDDSLAAYPTPSLAGGRPSVRGQASRVRQASKYETGGMQSAFWTALRGPLYAS